MVEGVSLTSALPVSVGHQQASGTGLELEGAAHQVLAVDALGGGAAHAVDRRADQLRVPAQQLLRGTQAQSRELRLTRLGLQRLAVGDVLMVVLVAAAIYRRL